MVFFLYEGQKIPNWSKDKQGYSCRLLEGHRQRQRDFQGKCINWDEENTGFLQGKSPKRWKNQLGHAWIQIGWYQSFRAKSIQTRNGNIAMFFYCSIFVYVGSRWTFINIVVLTLCFYLFIGWMGYLQSLWEGWLWKESAWSKTWKVWL